MTRKMSKNNFKVLLLCAITISLFCAQGCRKKQESPSPAPPNKTAIPATVVKQPEKPVQKQLSSSQKLGEPQHNQFDFSSKKDPFKPYIIIKKSAILTNGKSRKRNLLALPIHSYDVNQFRLIGIISGDKGSQAMVIDPNGKGYVLKIGMTIGKNDGRVMSITPNSVDVLEQFRDDNGRVRKEHIRISMPRKQ